MSQIVSFIDEHGVEPICSTLTEAQLPIAVSSYYAARSRPVSARAVSDAELDERIRQVHADNYAVYGYRKVWKVLNRQDPAHPVARCTVARRMRALGLHGALPARYGHRLGGVVPIIDGEDPIQCEVDVLRRPLPEGARLDGSLERHYVDLKGRPTARARVRLRHVRVDRLGPRAGCAPRGSHGLSQRHFP